MHLNRAGAFPHIIRADSRVSVIIRFAWMRSADAGAGHLRVAHWRNRKHVSAVRSPPSHNAQKGNRRADFQ